MRVYISTDMEGTAGVIKWEQVMPGNPEYEKTRLRQIAEINAAVEGALSAGAERVLVADLHYGGCNFPPESFHPEAEYYMGDRPAHTRFPCINEGFEQMFCIGYHAMAHTPGAILSHTMTGAHYMAFRINGIEMGELGMDALWAGLHDVGVGMVSGGAGVCREAREMLGEHVETAEVKRGFSRFGGVLIAPEKACGLIRDAAARAVTRAGDVLPSPFRLDPPYRLELDMASQEITEGKLHKVPGAVLKGKTTICIEGDDLNVLLFDILA